MIDLLEDIEAGDSIDEMIRKELENVDPQVAQFWEYLQSKYFKYSAKKENRNLMLRYAAFVSFCKKTRNPKKATPFSTYIGMFLYRKSATRPIWDLMSSMRLSISRTATEKLLTEKKIVPKASSQPLDVAIMAADNNDFYSKPENRGARAEKPGTMVNTIQRLIFSQKDLTGRRLLSETVPELAPSVPEASGDLSDQSIIFIDSKKEPDTAKVVEHRPKPIVQSRIEIIREAFSNRLAEPAQNFFFEATWAKLRQHIFPGGTSETRTLGDYPFPKAEGKIEPSFITVLEPELGADAKKINDMFRTLENLWNQVRDGNKVFGLIFGDENFIQVSASCKKKHPERLKWLLLFPGELHFRMHVVSGEYLIFFDPVISPIAARLKRPDIVKKFNSNKFAPQEEFLVLLGDCLFKWIEQRTEKNGARAFVNPERMLACKSKKLSDLFILFLHGILPFWMLRNSIRIGDAAAVNDLWIQFAPLFSITNKWRYQNLAIQVAYSLRFFPEGIRTILDSRFISYNGETNKMMAPDQLVEFVRSHRSHCSCRFFFPIAPDHK